MKLVYIIILVLSLCANERVKGLHELFRNGHLNESFVSIDEAFKAIKYAGDILEFEPGIYYEGGILIKEKHGTLERPIIIRSKPGGDKAIFRGVSANWTITGAGLWTHIGNGTYTTAMEATECGSQIYNFAYFAETGIRLFSYITYDDFVFKFAGQGIWADDVNDIMYIQLDDLENPNHVPIYFTSHCYILKIDLCSHFIVEDLEFQMSGRYGLYFSKSNDIIIRNIQTHGAHISLTDISKTTIHYNKLYDYPDYRWYWYDLKTHSANHHEISGIYVSRIDEVIIEHNDIAGYFNSMTGNGPWNNTVVRFNHCHYAMDDGIEIGVAHNLSIHHNLIHDTHAGISAYVVNPSSGCYIYKNVIVQTRTIKMAHIGEVYEEMAKPANPNCYKVASHPYNLKLYHNTCYGSHYGAVFSYEDQTNVEQYNNIFFSLGMNGTSPPYIHHNIGDHVNGNNYDYNLYWNAYNSLWTEGSRLKQYEFHWNEAGYYDLESAKLCTFAQNGNFEFHGLEEDPHFFDAKVRDLPWPDLSENMNDINFVDEIVFDWPNLALNGNSPAIDHAMPLPQNFPFVNEGFSGSGFDLGALEFGIDTMPSPDSDYYMPGFLVDRSDEDPDVDGSNLIIILPVIGIAVVAATGLVLFLWKRGVFNTKKSTPRNSNTSIQLNSF